MQQQEEAAHSLHPLQVGPQPLNTPNLFVPIGFAVAVSAFVASRLGGPLAAVHLSKSAKKEN